MLRVPPLEQKGGDEWGEDESQDMHVDDIVSGIARDVASRAPPSPRQVRHRAPRWKAAYIRCIHHLDDT